MATLARARAHACQAALAFALGPGCFLWAQLLRSLLRCCFLTSGLSWNVQGRAPAASQGHERLSLQPAQDGFCVRGLAVLGASFGRGRLLLWAALPPPSGWGSRLPAPAPPSLFPAWGLSWVCCGGVFSPALFPSDKPVCSDVQKASEMLQMKSQVKTPALAWDRYTELIFTCLAQSRLNPGSALCSRAERLQDSTRNCVLQD